MKRLRPEQLACIILVLALGGVSWWAFSTGGKRAQSTQRPLGSTTELESSTDDPSVRKTRVQSWAKAEPQSRGRGWVFDLFTPPEIEYNAATQEYRVKTTGEELPTVVTVVIEESIAEPVLLGVRYDDYPLQLTGFIGAGAQALGIFENRQSGETLLLRTGDWVESLGIEVLDFKVAQVTAEIPESMSVRENRAVATVRDHDGQVLTIREGLILPGTALLARIAIGEAVRELPEGAVLTQGPISYRVDKIRLAPASVDVTKETSGDGSTEKLVLKETPATQSNQL